MHRLGGWVALRPRGPSLGSGLCCPGPSSLNRPHPPHSPAHRDFTAGRRAALLVAFTVPGLATSSTTTATTGGPTTTTSEQYYLVRDPSTKKCTITTTKPTSSTTVVVGDTVCKTRTEAEGAVKTTKVCTE